MVKVKIIDASTSSYVESQTNKFLEKLDLEFGQHYKLHYSTSYLRDNSIKYSVMIEYEDSG